VKYYYNLKVVIFILIYISKYNLFLLAKMNFQQFYSSHMILHISLLYADLVLKNPADKNMFNVLL